MTDPESKPDEDHQVTDPVPPDDSDADMESMDRLSLINMAFLVEGAMFVIAVVVAWLFDFYDKQQPLSAINGQTWQTALFWGLVATIPMLVYLWVFLYVPLKSLRPMKEFLERSMKPIFARCTIMDLLILSFLAGFCEEILFRWCLQGGIYSLLANGVEGQVVAIAIASILFGFCHWVNASYGISTLFIGAYLGLVMVLTGTWLAPAVAHMLFDFVALLFLVRTRPPIGETE